MLELGEQVPKLQSPKAQRLGIWLLRRLGWQVSGNLPNVPKMVAAVAPHTSNWDFIVALAASFAIGVKISFLGKHSIFIWPIKNFLIRFGGIPIERSSAHGVVGQLVETFTREEQLILGIAPEGTRKRVPQWKSGFWQIARQAQVPILLVGLDFASKTVVFGPVLIPSDDFVADFAAMHQFFASMQPRYPENFA